MDLEENMNEFLLGIFQHVVEIESQVIITSEFKDISNNDMHIIEKIGLDEPKSMSTVAKALSVTTGTLTIAMNALVKKGYVEKIRHEQDGRQVFVKLTKTGRKVNAGHLYFHENMVRNVSAEMTEEEKAVLLKAMENLNRFFQRKLEPWEDA